jgi:hypothetical protein
MSENEVELFEMGDKVYTRVLEGEHEDGSLFIQHGLGTGPFWVEDVIQATETMKCHKLHPQLLALLDLNGDPVILFGLETSFPGFWFTKKDPGNLLGNQLGSAERDRVKGWLHNLPQAINEAIQESEAFLAILTDMEKDGYVPSIGFTIGIGKVVKGEESETGPEVNPLVKDGTIVTGTFTDDDKVFSKDFHIKLD